MRTSPLTLAGSTGPSNSIAIGPLTGAPADPSEGTTPVRPSPALTVVKSRVIGAAGELPSVSAAWSETVTTYRVPNASGETGVSVTVEPPQVARTRVAGVIVIADCVALTSIRRSNVSVIGVSTGTSTAPLAGVLDVSTGRPTVPNANVVGPWLATLPSTSLYPVDSVTVNFVATGSFCVGVKIMVREPSHVNVPRTSGTILKWSCADVRSTALLNSTSIVECVRATWESPVVRPRVIACTVGGTRSTSVAFARMRRSATIATMRAASSTVRRDTKPDVTTEPPAARAARSAYTPAL